MICVQTLSVFQRLAISVTVFAAVCIVGVRSRNVESIEFDARATNGNLVRRHRLASAFEIAYSGDGDAKPEGGKKPIAVLHIGPHKTGTTSLQTSIKRETKLLLKDEYFRPWKTLTEDREFASCFWPVHNKTQANFRSVSCESFEKSLTKLGRDGKNILLSAEGFSSIDDVAPLAEFINSHWEGRVVYSARWYHDWVFSLFNQNLKSRLRKTLDRFDEFKASRGNGKVHILLVPLIPYFGHIHNKYEKMSAAYKPNWYDMRPFESYDSIYRYGEYFKDSIVLDFEDKGISLQENLFCKGLNASRTCEHFRKERQEGAALVYRNRGHIMAYESIAYGAHQLALTSFHSKAHFEHVVEKIRTYQEGALGRTSADFPMDCIGGAVLNGIIDVSIERRRGVLPGVPLKRSAEKRIRAEFWKGMETKACECNVTAVLEQTEWVSFFATLDDNSTSFWSDVDRA